MQGIISPHTNEPVSVVKRSHNPERVNAIREQVDKDLAPLLQGYVNDMQDTKLGGTKGNEPAIYEHYDSEWRATCARREKSSEPVTCDPEAFSKHIAAHKQQMARAELSQKAIVDLDAEGLNEWDLVRVGRTHMGAVLMSNRFALLLDAAGICYMHIPDIGAGDKWPTYLVHEINEVMLPFHLKKAGLRVIDLATFMNALGIAKWNPPSSQQVYLATAKPAYARKWWNPRTW